MEPKDHNKCKFYGFRTCPHRKDEIMERATFDVPEYHGGELPTVPPPPTAEEINAICSTCDKFTPLR